MLQSDQLSGAPIVRTGYTFQSDIVIVNGATLIIESGVKIIAEDVHVISGNVTNNGTIEVKE